MNDCQRYEGMRIEWELSGKPPEEPHCPDCSVAARAIVTVIRAGRRLGEIEPPAEAIEAGRRRLLEAIARSGGRGLAAFLALAGGVFLAALAASDGASGRHPTAEAIVSVAAGSAGAVAAAATADSRNARGASRLPLRRFRASSRDASAPPAPSRFRRAPAAGLPLFA